MPALEKGVAPQNFQEMWAGFDPRREPLEIETIKEWEEDGVVLRIIRFRIGVFKGQQAKLAAIYGFPKGICHNESAEKLPGLVQIHGGGQYADHRACLINATRGYATVSISWAGRISAPDYRVTPTEVKLFWDGKTNDPGYKLTADGVPSMVTTRPVAIRRTISLRQVPHRGQSMTWNLLAIVLGFCAPLRHDAL